MPDFEPAGPPRFFFWTDSVTQTVAFLTAEGVDLVSEITDIGSVDLVMLGDRDGNLLMTCERRG